MARDLEVHSRNKAQGWGIPARASRRFTSSGRTKKKRREGSRRFTPTAPNAKDVDCGSRLQLYRNKPPCSIWVKSLFSIRTRDSILDKGISMTGLNTQKHMNYQGTLDSEHVRPLSDSHRGNAVCRMRSVIYTEGMGTRRSTQFAGYGEGTSARRFTSRGRWPPHALGAR
ncbi:hypothetical protein B0H10DRAFT_1940665 [Mycena sp. CBHHK59/15]|nr:hypothetical protein B0H10DRAFT_1940665 [Mycena sp. CBHHK59/15]